MSTQCESAVASSWTGDARDLQAALDEHAIVAITDPAGRITFVNDRFCAISRFTREELIGKDHRIVDSHYHPDAFFRELWSTIVKGGVWRGEIRNRSKDGSFYWVSTTIVPSFDACGQLRQFIAIGADITERKRIEAELAEKLRVEKLLAELSARFVALPSAEVDAAIEETQRLVVESFGLDRSTLWQRNGGGESMTLTHCWQRPGWPPLPISMTTTGQLPWSFAEVMAGRTICFSRVDELPPEAARDLEAFRQYCSRSNITIPLVTHGRPFGALSFATLGTEREWREDEIVELKLVAQIIGNVVSRERAELREEQLREELAHAMRVATLGEMATTLAHELNQPLTAILSNAQAARRFIASGHSDPAEITRILDDIVRDDKRAGAVIHNLRAMVSKHSKARERCCLNQLATEVVSLLRGEFTAAKLEPQLRLAPSLPLVDAVRVELQQVLVNLLLNAIQAACGQAGADCSIDLETTVADSMVEVRIRDRGPGIPAEALADIFEPFHSTKPSGLGMGLSISRRIIEGHGGEITAHLPKDGGTVLRFTLPAVTRG